MRRFFAGLALGLAVAVIVALTSQHGDDHPIEIQKGSYKVVVDYNTNIDELIAKLPDVVVDSEINDVNFAANRESNYGKVKDEIEVVLVRFTEFDAPHGFVQKVFNFLHWKAENPRGITCHETWRALEAHGLRSLKLRELLAFEIAYPNLLPDCAATPALSTVYHNRSGCQNVRVYRGDIAGKRYFNVALTCADEGHNWEKWFVFPCVRIQQK